MSEKPIENRLAISLPDLKKRGYFDHCPAGALSWYLGERLVATVSIVVSIDAEYPQRGGTLYLTYQQSGQSVRQAIPMVHRVSNLGCGGGIWYFLCPLTGRRCRTLIEGRSGFASRHAQGGLRYRAQGYSRKYRAWAVILRELRQKERALQGLEWLSKPNCKRVYGGKLTRPMRRFLRLSGLGDATSIRKG